MKDPGGGAYLSSQLIITTGGSATYGQWVGVTLSAEKKNLFYVPAGFAHGFLVLSDTAEFVYKCTDVYDPSSEGGIPWNDPDIAVAVFVNYEFVKVEYIKSIKYQKFQNPNGEDCNPNLKNVSVGIGKQLKKTVLKYSHERRRTRKQMAGTRSINYIKQTRAKRDRCNICGRIRDLTWDHVPPKATLLNPNVYASTVFSHMPSAD